jgi:hypothetical protein
MAKSPRQTMGKVVSALAAAADIRVAETISGRTTERLENTGRRLKAMRRTEIPRSHLRARADAEPKRWEEVEATTDCRA